MLVRRLVATDRQRSGAPTVLGPLRFVHFVATPCQGAVTGVRSRIDFVADPCGSGCDGD